MKDYSGGIEKAIQYYHGKWGGKNNYHFFHDAIIHSSNKKIGLPRFYILLKDNVIIGCCGLIINDFISRHDLYPWLCGLFIEESERGKSLGNMLIKHVVGEAINAGYNNVYLTTDHNGYYEKYGWNRIEDGYEIFGNQTRIYMRKMR